MLDELRRFFAPPPGRIDAGSVRMRLLSRVLNMQIAVGLALSLLYPDRSVSGMAVSAVAFATIPLALLLRGFMHRGRVRLASWIFLITISLIAPGLSVYLTGSVAVVSVSVVQMTMIVMAGLLLGGREALAFAAVILCSNGGFFWIEGLRVPSRAPSLQGAWVLQAVFYSATAALLARAITLTEEAFELAAREAAERRVAEAALRESMERYRLITSVSSDYAFSTELESGPGLRLNWVAGAFEQITGFTFDEYVARGGWRAAVHPDDLDQDDQDLLALRGNLPVATEIRTICKDGSLRWVRVYAHPVWDDSTNSLRGIFGAVQDISERKAAEAEREKLIHELEGRNAELERFTYTVSHDLKSPLITIRGFLGHIEQAAREGRLEAVRADMDRVYKSTAKMHQLLDDLLELSRIGRLAKAPEDVPFEAILRDALDLTHGRLTAAKVAVEIEGPLPVVRVDRDRLVEVVQNLVDNAAKFMGAQENPRIVIGAKETARGLAFFVRDNGEGIDPRYSERVFNLFDKLDPKSSGTGVGLALVKRIVEVHGGRVWVETAGKGHGSTFLFTLADQPPTIPQATTDTGETPR